MKFWKMNGAGNDFVLINNLEEQIPHEKLPALARTLCERHLSIGADGLMAVDQPEPGVDADIRMLFFNSDGSVGEMCGNGARCICRYCYENKLTRDTEHADHQTIQTTAGIVTGERISARLYRIQLNDPGEVELQKMLKLEPAQVPGILKAPLEVACSYITLGNPGIPHLMVEYKDALAAVCSGAAASASGTSDTCGGSSDMQTANADRPHLKDADENILREVGRALRFHPALPKGANVNFYEMLGEDLLLLRTFERGVEDFTYACGTGTGSLVAALYFLGRVSGKQVRVRMTGGELIIDMEGYRTPENAHIFLTGPTNIVCKGEVTDEELQL